MCGICFHPTASWWRCCGVWLVASVKDREHRWHSCDVGLDLSPKWTFCFHHACFDWCSVRGAFREEYAYTRYADVPTFSPTSTKRIIWNQSSVLSTRTNKRTTRLKLGKGSTRSRNEHSFYVTRLVSKSKNSLTRPLRCKFMGKNRKKLKNEWSEWHERKRSK